MIWKKVAGSVLAVVWDELVFVVLEPHPCGCLLGFRRTASRLGRKRTPYRGNPGPPSLGALGALGEWGDR